MIAVVGGIDDISVVQNSVMLEACDKYIDQVIDGLESTQSVAIPRIIVINIGLILARKLRDPPDPICLWNVLASFQVFSSRMEICKTNLRWIEVRCPRNDGVGGHVSVSVGGNRWRYSCCAIDVTAVDESTLYMNS